jgi:hypothetical protein
MTRKISLLKEFLPTLLPKYKAQFLEAFSAHDLLTAYIKVTLVADPKLDGHDLDGLAHDLLYPVDDAAEERIKAYLSDRSDEDYEAEQEP